MGRRWNKQTTVLLHYFYEKACICLWRIFLSNIGACTKSMEREEHYVWRQETGISMKHVCLLCVFWKFRHIYNQNHVSCLPMFSIPTYKYNLFPVEEEEFSRSFVHADLYMMFLLLWSLTFSLIIYAYCSLPFHSISGMTTVLLPEQHRLEGRFCAPSSMVGSCLFSGD